MHRRYRCWVLVSPPPSGCGMIRLLRHDYILLNSSRSQRPLRALTAWSCRPRSDQSCLFFCRANRRTTLANLHHLPQVISMRSKTRSSSCNISLVQVGVCIYTHYTDVLLRKTSRMLLSLEPNGVSHLHSIAHTNTQHTLPS